jgi:hypothetical protein
MVNYWHFVHCIKALRSSLYYFIFNLELKKVHKPYVYIKIEGPKLASCQLNNEPKN